MSIFNAEQWAKSHLQHAKLGDVRRADRLVSTLANMARSSGKSIAPSCRGNEAELEGAYRLIRNDNISPDMIRVAGFQHTANEAASVAEILALIIPMMLMKKKVASGRMRHIFAESV
ncbi:protein of unknown function, might belong to Transposase [Shewanella benthica]|uniref:Transposase Tn5-like N-terminal domain-containing protein n=1 Tax=Shewanella benthica TaxID=43661 RepID=A0A330M0N8_9GAMM|nr:transposase DNA-binding-containing protein [Shewanella benthica]SQH76219.1 protein of unknown function, might belong to Transposase [Shewanella benthica]